MWQIYYAIPSGKNQSGGIKMLKLSQRPRYRIRQEDLCFSFKEAIGRELTDWDKNWYDSIIPYIEIAYHTGCMGEKLTSVFSFLEVAE